MAAEVQLAGILQDPLCLCFPMKGNKHNPLSLWLADLRKSRGRP